MIPLRSTERVYSKSYATGGIIALNLLIFLYQVALPEDSLAAFIEHWGIVPDNISGHLYTLLTSMFLHGGWMHVLGNMLFLWVFGRNVEDLIGSGRFVVFYLLVGLAAAVVQVIASPYSRLPTIGASGAIAGVMGAYLIKFPRARVVTLFFFIFITTVEIPAALMLVVWFITQFANGVGSLARTDYTGGGIAWFAHIGGFIAGMLLIRAFPPQQRRWRAWQDAD